MTAPLTVGLVAGESSGDTLGAALIEAIRQRHPQASFFGVAGPKMRAAGCEVWASSDELAVMGLTEVLRHLPRLLRLRAALVARFIAAKPSVFVGIDAPEFNLGLEARLKRAGVPTVQYVSPQVWAWRQGRVASMAKSCDRVLCLLPFETEFYRAHHVRASFVGHPLADQIAMEPDRAAARQSLGLAATDVVVALLPGSRLGEVARLGADFLGAASWLSERLPGVKFLAPMASPAVRREFAALAASQAPAASPQLVDGQAQSVLAAADAVLVASGTATLETLLSKRPMVVAYRLGGVTAFLLRRLGLVKVAHFAQPNLLLGRRAVPEFLQEGVTPAALGAALLQLLRDPAATAALVADFRRVHAQLRCGGAALAAQAVLEVAGREPLPAPIAAPR
jgi:lipid-A-disaccharide synthase